MKTLVIKKIMGLVRLRILAMLKRAIALVILRPKLSFHHRVRKQAVLRLKPLVRANRPL